MGGGRGKQACKVGVLRKGRTDAGAVLGPLKTTECFSEGSLKGGETGAFIYWLSLPPSLGGGPLGAFATWAALHCFQVLLLHRKPWARKARGSAHLGRSPCWPLTEMAEGGDEGPPAHLPHLLCRAPQPLGTGVPQPSALSLCRLRDLPNRSLPPPSPGAGSQRAALREGSWSIPEFPSCWLRNQ